MIQGLNHVGIAVRNLEHSFRVFADLFGVDPQQVHREKVEEQGVEILSFVVGNVRIELLAPLSGDSPIARFIEKRGEGIHHLSFETDDIVKQMKELADRGFQLVHSEPRLGAHNMWIAFLHPKSTNGVLVELCQNRIDQETKTREE